MSATPAGAQAVPLAVRAANLQRLETAKDVHAEPPPEEEDDEVEVCMW